MGAQCIRRPGLRRTMGGDFYVRCGNGHTGLPSIGSGIDACHVVVAAGARSITGRASLLLPTTAHTHGRRDGLRRSPSHREPVGLEGIVSKKKDVPYGSRNSGWINVKCPSWREANKDHSDLFNKQRRRCRALHHQMNLLRLLLSALSSLVSVFGISCLSCRLSRFHCLPPSARLSLFGRLGAARKTTRHSCIALSLGNSLAAMLLHRELDWVLRCCAHLHRREGSPFPRDVEISSPPHAIYPA
jgi:hypothetical protein